MPPASAPRVALGFSPHIGWAAVVALSGPRDAPRLVAKRRVVMATTFETGAVYHAAQALPPARAEALVAASERTFAAAARADLAAIVADLRDRGLEPIASAVPRGAARPLPPLAAILRSHALVHAAEGELYRRVLAHASEACGIPAASVAARDLAALAARAAGLPEERLAPLLAAMGRASGRPWARDQKLAALAAWVALGPTGG